MYPPCQRLVLGGMEELRPFLRSIESHFLECQSKSEQVLPPFRHEPPICRPSDWPIFNSVLSIHIWRALHPATYVGGRSIWRFCLNAGRGRWRQHFLAAHHGSDCEALTQINFLSLFSLPNRASASEIILSSKAAPTSQTQISQRVHIVVSKRNVSKQLFSNKNDTEPVGDLLLKSRKWYASKILWNLTVEHFAKI